MPQPEDITALLHQALHGDAVVEADARANEHFLHAGNLAQLAQEANVVGMVGD